ncbi:hypothetical protein M422DRAFT_274545 [Sphaerobolus stellatus SS14]|uniref:Major facilitator superfamily (MFS) profile domain-containing protein n=1 Tax=Sphaerobolus stellatus (strain SS14) TaxID=990650 RepID=A0A0C9TRV0_SPHS4|nr:hypothetical protein M422DRAFT_274545 [Sphaerobolus stellatus SS14]
MADTLARARTVTLLGSVLTALSSGTNYVYSAYAPQLGSRLRITYTQLNIIGLSGNMGVYTTGPILGRIVDKRGPRPLLLSSFFLLLIGYTGLRSYFDAGPIGDDKLPTASLIALSLFSYMTGVGGNCGLSAAVNSTAKSFPDRLRASTVGFVLSGFGLSAFFFSTLSHLIFPGNTSSFLLFLALGTSLPIIVCFFTVRPVPHAERPDPGPGGLVWQPETIDSSSRLLAHEEPVTAVSSEIEVHSSVGELYPEVVTPIERSRSRSRPSFELSRQSDSARRPGIINRMGILVDLHIAFST